MGWFAESWFVVALFSSSLLFWSFVLFTGLLLAALLIWGGRVLSGILAAVKYVTDGGGKDRTR